MADGRPLEGKIIELFNSDVNLRNLFNRDNFTELSEFMPVDNKYPQICIWLDQGDSEPIFPAGRYDLDITIWVDKKKHESYAFFSEVSTRINYLINRRGDNLSEIDVNENRGLRVAYNTRSGGHTGFDDKIKKPYRLLTYDAVVSEDESFAEEDAGDRPWQ